MRRSNNIFRKQLLLQIAQLAAMRYDNPNVAVGWNIDQDPASWLRVYNKEAGGRHIPASESFKINFLTAFINHLN